MNGVHHYPHRASTQVYVGNRSPESRGLHAIAVALLHARRGAVAREARSDYNHR